MVVMNFEKDFVKMCCINIVGQCACIIVNSFIAEKKRKFTEVHLTMQEIVLF